MPATPHRTQQTGDEVRRDEESLLRYLVRRSSLSQQQRERVEQQVSAIEDLVALTESLAEESDRLAEQCDVAHEPALAQQAREIEKKVMRHEQHLIRYATAVLTDGLEIQPEHADEWVKRLYGELEMIRTVLSQLFDAVTESVDSSDVLRQALESNYRELNERLRRAEDNPRTAVATFGSLVHFIEIVLELALKFGGRIDHIWQSQARDLIVPLLR
ncbi:MAG TPA: hypothetical protein VFU48_12725 [Nitrospira sp.]|nr:hypothetical protein [Nitrospira sp.]